MWLTTFPNNNISYDNLRLTFNAKFLAFIFSIGLFFVFLVSYISLNGLKANFDEHFPHTLQEIKMLDNFQNQYVLEAINAVQYSTTSKHNRSLILWRMYNDERNNSKHNQGGFNFIRYLYKSIFARSIFVELEALANFKEDLISQINFIINTESKVPLDLIHISNNAKEISMLSSLIVNTEDSIYQLERSITDNFFIATINMLWIITLLVFGIVVSLSYVILGFAKRFNFHLKKLLDKATKDLRDLNENLQQEIKAQVQTIRQKDEIMHTQAKFATMGEMIQNISHQWRQPLNSIMLIIQTIKSKYDKGLLSQEILKDQTKLATTIAQNMSKTIDDFRTFFRMEGASSSFSIKESIQDSISLNEPIFNSIQMNIDIECDEDIKIYGNKQVLMQVLLVLLSNSKDAFLDNNIEKGSCFIKAEKTSDIIQIVYYDNCGGIQEEYLERIFEPYFTTKHKSVGTGIGLYMAKELIYTHLNGKIIAKNYTFTLDDVEQHGALFVILIPTDKNIMI